MRSGRTRDPRADHADMAGPRRFATPAARERAALTGEFSDWAVPSRTLRPEHVPSRGAAWDEVYQFALGYDGYALCHDVGGFANQAVQSWRTRHVVPSALDELRACLFFEQRRYHHFGTDPDGPDADYVWALLDAIRAACAGRATSTGE